MMARAVFYSKLSESRAITLTLLAVSYVDFGPTVRAPRPGLAEKLTPHNYLSHVPLPWRNLHGPYKCQAIV